MGGQTMTGHDILIARIPTENAEINGDLLVSVYETGVTLGDWVDLHFPNASGERTIVSLQIAQCRVLESALRAARLKIGG